VPDPMHRLTTLVAGLMLALALASPALAAGRGQIIRDCADDGQLQGKYTQSELRDARQNLPSDVAEYTDCADVLRRAELPDRDQGGAGGGGNGGGGGSAASGGGGGGGPSTPTTDAERRELAKAATSGGAAVEVGGRSIVPGAAGLGGDAASNDVPVALIVVLALLALGGAALAAPAVRRTFPGLGRGS
jgi:hypothetical protein